MSSKNSVACAAEVPKRRYLPAVRGLSMVCNGSFWLYLCFQMFVFSVARRGHLEHLHMLIALS